MGMKIQKHHSEHLDGTKGRWRPALVPSKLTGSDGHALSHDEIVVISCPGCGAPQGIGADDVKIVDGKTDRIHRCYDARCRYELPAGTEFELHQEPQGREHFAKLKDEAMKDIAAARIRHAVNLHHQNARAELEERVKGEVAAMLGDGTDPKVYQKVVADLLKKSNAAAR